MSDHKLIRLTPNQPDKNENNSKNHSEETIDAQTKENYKNEGQKKPDSTKQKIFTIDDVKDLKKESLNQHANLVKPKVDKRKITSIKSQKRKGRYNIYIDGEYAFPVAESVLVKYMLTKGMTVSKELQKKLETEDNFSKSYTRALNYLSYSLRTEKQVRDDLIDKDFGLFVDEVIFKLKDQNLINDLEYAKSYIRTSARINQKGPRVIANELRTKGITELKIEDAMTEYSYNLQLENARKLIEKQMRKPNKSSEREKMNKISAFLYGKGYSSDVINEAMEIVEPEIDEDAEYEALVKQANKAWRRYQRKSSGYELIQKLKAYLYSKGYPSDLINRYIDQKNEDEQIES